MPVTPYSRQPATPVAVSDKVPAPTISNDLARVIAERDALVQEVARLKQEVARLKQEMADEYSRGFDEGRW